MSSISGPGSNNDEKDKKWLMWDASKMAEFGFKSRDEFGVARKLLKYPLSTAVEMLWV